MYFIGLVGSTEPDSRAPNYARGLFENDLEVNGYSEKGSWC
jgi:hypothetical protein